MFKIPDKLKQFGYGFIIYKTITILRALAINPIIFLISDKETVSAVLMVLNTFFSSLIMIFIYDYIKEDYLFIESYKKSKENKEEQVLQNSVTKKITKWSNAGNGFLVFGLTIWDPAIAVVYCREGSYKWNNIPNVTMLFLLFISSLSCNVIGLIFLKSIKDLILRFI